MTMYKITRGELSKLAARVLDKSHASSELRAAILEVAATAPYIALNCWQMRVPDVGPCGCLVGWLHDPVGNDGDWTPASASNRFRETWLGNEPNYVAERVIGFRFDELLRDHLGVEDGNNETAAVEVVG